MILAYACAILIWLSMITYAVLGGADFGGGIWDLFSLGPEQEDKRQLIVRALGPVWEANNVWLIYIVVGLYTAFPVVAATLATALFIPFSLVLIGVVLRGAAFAFRTSFSGAATPRAIWGRAFDIASIITPFLLGTCAAAVASGRDSPTKWAAACRSVGTMALAVRPRNRCSGIGVMRDYCTDLPHRRGPACQE